MNIPNLVSTCFQNLESGDKSYGVRWYDDFENGYANFSEKQGKVPADEQKLFEYAKRHGGDAFKKFIESSVLDSLNDDIVLMINGIPYEKKEIALWWGS